MRFILSGLMAACLCTAGCELKVHPIQPARIMAPRCGEDCPDGKCKPATKECPCCGKDCCCSTCENCPKGCCSHCKCQADKKPACPAKDQDCGKCHQGPSGPVIPSASK